MLACNVQSPLAVFYIAFFSHQAVSSRQGTLPLIGESLSPFGSSNSSSAPAPLDAVNLVKADAELKGDSSLHLSAGTAAKSEYELFKVRHEFEQRSESLKHAQTSLANMEEQATSKLKEDTNDIDHMLVRRHMLTDKEKETSADAAALGSEASELKKLSADASRAGRTRAAAAADSDAAGLEQVASLLGGSADEVHELDSSIKIATDDGKQMDARIKDFAKHRALLDRQIQRLEDESQHQSEKYDEKDDFRSMETSSSNPMESEEDDPYMKEAAEALEKASGWNGEKLDSDAVKAREAMTSGLTGGRTSGAVQALRGAP